MSDIRRGSCNCGAVRLEVEGAPMRAGLCHCMTCRKETGSTFMAFAVWTRNQVRVTGETARWTGTTDSRHFCPGCGSRLFASHEGDEEIEVRLGCLDDAPGDLTPEYELWTVRREHWSPAVRGSAQYDGDRP